MAYSLVAFFRTDEMFFAFILKLMFVSSGTIGQTDGGSSQHQS